MKSLNKLSLKLKLKNLTINTSSTAQSCDSTQALNLQKSSNVSIKFFDKVRKFDTMSKNQRIHEINSTISHNFWDLFEKKQKLGEGAHSVVYECIEKVSRKNFAVKIPQNMDAQRIQGVKETFLIMKQLDHPYILKTDRLYIQANKKKCYLVTQLCKYQDLRSYIQKLRQKNQKMSLEQIAKILKKTLEALNYLKKKGICHRDIKPQNILYQPSTGNLKLIDFELARMKNYEHDVLDLWTDTGSLFYRAPESFAFGYNQAIDIWAVGVIAFQIFTGKLPFSSSSVKGTINQIKNKEIDFDSLNISNIAKKFLLNMLQKDPKKRLTPEQALRSPFLLKNFTFANSNLSQVKIKKVSQEPGLTKHNQDFFDVSQKHKWYDETFMSQYLRYAQPHYGIITNH